MADNIKISELTELTSGSLSDATIFPVVDGGSTKKASLSSLQSYLTDDLATDAELSSQISTVNSTINTLTTSDISEGTNQYFTNARADARIEAFGVITSSAAIDLTQTTNYISGIKTRLNVENVISSSNQVSESAALAGFGSGGGGASIPTGTVSSSAQTVKNLGGTGIISGSLTSDDITDFNDAVSSSAAAAGFSGGEGGGGGSTDYVSNVTFSGTTLTFTGTGNAFSSTVDLSGESLATSTDIAGFLAASTYIIDSGSFASRLDAGGGGGGGVPSGTISSSAQILGSLSGSNLVSSSQQIDGAQIDLSSLTTDDVSEGVTNRYYANSLVLPYLNSLQVLSGSAGGGFDVSGTNVVSSSTQISNLGFVSNTIYGTGTASLQNQIDTLDNQLDSSVLTDSVNDFTVTQKFRDIEVTGSVNITGIFSGSGAYLFDIPGTAIVGGVALSGSTIEDGNVSVVANTVSGITMNSTASGININGDVRVASGSLISGSGAGLYDIPGSAIVGGVGGGQSIASGSITASIEANGLVINSGISASGEITAQSISVGTSGTPTIYSNNNLNLSASNAVVITDSPLRLNPFAAADTASFTLAEGDMVFSSDQNDFFGYRIVNSTGSWYSLTEGNITEVEWSTIIGAPQGLVSSSFQIAPSGSSLFSSSAQFLPSGSVAGTVYFEDTLDNISGSSDFTYTAGTRTLNVNKVIANELVYNTSLTGAGNDTGSYGRVETDRLSINSAIEFPFADGTINQVLKTDGNGNLDFAAFADVLGNDNITTNGTITMGTGSVNTTLTVDGTLNIGSPIHSTINNQSSTIDVDSLSLLSSGSMLLSSSVNVTIEDVLVLPERASTPANPVSGSIIVSGSGITIKPYFWDGANWNALY